MGDASEAVTRTVNIGTLKESMDALATHLASLDETERYRSLMSFVANLANRENGSSNSAKSASAEQAEFLARKVQRLSEENAQLKDELATCRVDLAQRTRLLESEQVRAQELQLIVESQKTRLDTLAKERDQFEQRLVAQNAEINRVQFQNDQLNLRLQRAELVANDPTRGIQLEEDKSKLALDLSEASRRIAQLREEKDAEIEDLKSQLQSVRAVAHDSADKTLAALWQRLAIAKPALSPPGLQPTTQMAERLVDSMIELTRFNHELDGLVRPFLTRYTKLDPNSKRQWETYTKDADILQTVNQIVGAPNGKHFKVLTMRLNHLKRWMYATMIGGDSAFECIASSLESELRGALGMGMDPNIKVKDFLFKNDGPERFLESMRKLRSEKIAEAFGHVA